MKILLTTTSFQDTPGKHQDLLNQTGFKIDRLRGPLQESALLPIIANYSGIICGDDEITKNVIRKGAEGKLKIISKYGVGLDNVDLKAAQQFNIPVTNCEGVNHITVAEHFFALLLAFYKNICKEYEFIKGQSWKRLTGREIFEKKLGIIGLGKIGKEIAKRAKAFGLEVYAHDLYFDEAFLKEYAIIKCSTMIEVLQTSDIVSLNLPLTYETKNLISMDTIKNHFKKNSLLVNTSRAGLVELEAIIYGLENRILSGYLTDVLEEEPMKPNHPLLKFENVLITPHIGSRTYESVQRQGMMAVQNLLNHLK